MKLKKFLVSLAVLVLLTTSVLGQNKPSNQPGGINGGANGAPAMVIDSYTHDFGEVKAGTPLRYAFKVKNEGKADLVISNVAPG